MPARPERRSRAPALALALALVPARAAAADSEPIRIVFHAPAACPDEAAFTAQVTARTARARIAAAGEVARTFTISITAQEARTRGTLRIDDPAGSPATRVVSGVTCEEVVSALGLITALAIDPRASTAPTPLAPAPALPPPAAPIAPVAPPPPRPPLPPPPRYDALPWWGPVGEPLPVIPAPSPEPRWRLAWGLRAGAASAVAPGWVVTYGGFAEVARSGGGVLSPVIRLGYLHADSGWLAVGDGHQASFAISAGRVEACPVRLELSATLAAYPCALFDAGAVQASGVGKKYGATHLVAWAAPGAVARLGWDVLDRVFVEAEGGVNFPLFPDTFSFTTLPGMLQAVHTVPAVGGFFAGGVGTRFP